MKFKELKKVLSCCDSFGISLKVGNLKQTIYCNHDNIDEISNSYKVDGYRYISDGTGCSNKWTIKETPTGIYFIDSITNTLPLGTYTMVIQYNGNKYFEESSLTIEFNVEKRLAICELKKERYCGNLLV